MARTQARNEPQVFPIPRPEDQLVGRRLMRRIDEQLGRLRTHAAHGNRTFFYDQLVVAHLLAFFNPVLHSLRRIEDAFDIPRISRLFDMRGAAKSTVADAQRLFDPELLRPIYEDLVRRVQMQPHDTRLDALTRQLTAVDGSFFAVAARIVWAVYNHSRQAQPPADGSRKTGRRGLTTQGNVRAHVHFDILRGVPEQLRLTDGQTGESRMLSQMLRPEHCYVLDRGFQSYELFGEILKVNSDFVARLRKSARCQGVQALPLTAADLLAGVQSDARVRIGWRADQAPPLPLLRRVELAVEGADQPIVLLTSCFDLPAETIALIYKHRWQIELFFRWLKCMAHLEHFFSESQRGMTLQLYVTLIATLLIALETGARPSVYDFALMSLVMSGLAPLEEALATAAKRRAERERAARRHREKAAQKDSL